MASTNKTANLGLNRWDASDPVEMADFNADNAKLDEIVGGLEGRLRVEMIRNLTLSPYNTTLISVDVSDMKLQDYTAVFFDFPYIAPSRLGINDCEMKDSRMVTTNTSLAFFPPPGGDAGINFLKLYDGYASCLHFNEKYNEIRKFNFLVSSPGDYHANNTRIMIWGVR